eukprot:COSAG01_NODE_280_length_19520_cov_9.720406_15_plen_318_part_00
MAATRGPVELPGTVFPGHGRAQHTQGSVVGEVVESAALSGNLALRVRLRLGNLENTSVVRLDELREPTAAELAEYQAQRRRWTWCIPGVQVRIAVGLPCLRRTLATDAASGVGRSAIVVSTDKEGFVRLRFSDGTEDVVKTTRLQHIADQQSDDAYALREEAQQWQGLVDTFHMGAYAKVDSTQRRGAIRSDKWEGQVCAPLTRLRVDRKALLLCPSDWRLDTPVRACVRAWMHAVQVGIVAADTWEDRASFTSLVKSSTAAAKMLRKKKEGDQKHAQEQEEEDEEELRGCAKLSIGRYLLLRPVRNVVAQRVGPRL